jgi:diphthine-ammonia ligase
VYEEGAVGDEVEDLHALLSYVKAAEPGLQAVASGAIASDYQRSRVERVCARLGLVSLAYLWHQPQARLLRDMVGTGRGGLEEAVVEPAPPGE